MDEIGSDAPATSPAPTRRHGCLTTYLIFLIVANTALSLIYLFGSGPLQSQGLKMPTWAFWVLALCGVINVISAVALLRWQRWGFWAFVASALLGIAVNITIGLGPQGVIGAVAGILILYGVLNIGREQKAWPRLQ